MIAYNDNENTVVLKNHLENTKENRDLYCELLEQTLGIPTNTLDLLVIKDYYWPIGTHYYKPLNKSLYTSRENFIEKAQHPERCVLVVGEVVSNNPELLKTFKRAIAFDRKMTGSIITRQMAQQCCSDEFADALIEEFSKSGVTMQKDKTGYYTDTGNFIELIPECTNISIGVWDEHHNTEWVDISYVEKIAMAACKIDWDSLPTIREPKWWLDEQEHQSDPGFIKKYSKFKNRKNDAKIFQLVSDILDDENYLLMSRWGFEPGKEMVFNNWFEESPVKVKVMDNQVTINGQIFPFNKRLKNSILNKIKK
jgi:hypothetical protein